MEKFVKKQSNRDKVHEKEGMAKTKVPYHQTHKDKRDERGAIKRALKDHAPKCRNKAM